MTDINRTTRGTFAKGVSGNPGGKPKVAGELLEIQTLARSKTKEAFERIIQLMDSTDESVALRASEHVLDRGWGRPSQNVTAEITQQFAFLLPEQAATEEAWLQQQTPRLLDS